MEWAGKLAAAVIAVLCIAAMIYLNRATLFPSDNKQEPGLNPAYVECRDKRIGTVRKMRDEGVISKEQFNQFSARAEALCASQFPPDGAAKP